MRISDWSSDVCSSDLLIEHGSVERGHFGIVCGQEVTPELAKALNWPSSRGALVGRVLPKSPADKAGIKAGDLIVEANGKPILDFGQLRNMVGLMRVDDKVDLKLYRGGKPKNISVKIGKDEKKIGRAPCGERVCQDV